MSRYKTYTDLINKVNELPTGAKILDIGGWFDPFNLATHVVDLFPYETRNSTIQNIRQNEERFSKETWFQYNFLAPNLTLPFSDHFFDFVVCCHTLEDLENPLYLLKEIKRISKAGYIEVPSRLDEQTLGVRDRASNKSGHPHHYWIIDKVNDSLIFYSKEASLKDGNGWEIPLIFTEQFEKKNKKSRIVEYYFNNNLEFSFVQNEDKNNVSTAIQFVKDLNIPRSLYVKDYLLRFGRRMRQWVKNEKENYDWYDEIITISEPYSSIPLR